MTPGEAQELRAALIRMVSAAVTVGLVLGWQWWVITPQPEREVKLRRYGLTHCTAGRWHFRGIPRSCLCRWQEGDMDARLAADLAERAAIRGQEK